LTIFPQLLSSIKFNYIVNPWGHSPSHYLVEIKEWWRKVRKKIWFSRELKNGVGWGEEEGGGGEVECLFLQPKFRLLYFPNWEIYS